MANELTLSGSLAYADSEGSDLSLALSEILASVATKKFVHHKQNIPTSEEALDLGELTALGWGIFINRDETNFVEIRVGTGGNDFVKIPPGKFALFHFGSDVTAPFAIADTAACQLEYVIVNT
jgi:hypothetical protein